MKKYSKFISVFLISVIAIALTACSSQPKTLEEYLDKNSDAKSQIESLAADTKGLELTVKDNTINYSYDISSIGGSSLTEEIALSKEMKDTFEKQIESSSNNFTSICKQLEDETGITGIEMIVSYNYSGKEIITKKFKAE